VGELVDVRVLDAHLRPIEGAGVNVTYDRGASFGEQYFSTPVLITDSEGKAHIDIYNQGTLFRTIDCGIVIWGMIGGSQETVEVNANEHGQVVDVALSDVYPVIFQVRNHHGIYFENATVNFENVQKTTDSRGLVTFYSIIGNHS